MERYDADYERLMQERADANLTYLAARLKQADEARWAEEFAAEAAGELPPVPADMDERLTAFVRGLDRETRRKARRNRWLKVAKRCAVFVLVVGLIGIATISGSAWKYKIAGFFTQEQEGHTDLIPYETDLLADWHDYYMLSEVPEGYELVSAEQSDTKKVSLFTDGKSWIRFEQAPANMRMTIDNEHTEIKKIEINGKKGILICGKEEDYLSVFWIQGEYALDLEKKGNSSIDEEKIVELAEKIKYFE